MKPIKKITAMAITKTPVSSASILKKIKSPLTVNFPITKGADLDGSEIVIKIEGSQIIVKLIVKGVPIGEQILPVKKIPNPPPMPKDEVIKALEQLRFNFNIKK